LSGPEAASGRAFCADARAALDHAGGRAGDVRLRLTCLDDAGSARLASTGAEPQKGAWRLAAVGANARRATEDSGAIAYLGEPQAAAARFSLPILETAGIGQAAGSSGGAAMTTVLRAVREAGDASELRDAVREALSQ